MSSASHGDIARGTHSLLHGSARHASNLTSEDLLESIFPPQYSYKVISCDIVDTSSLPFEDINFDLELRVNVSSIPEVKTFLKRLNESSACTFNILHGRADKEQSGPKSRSLLRGFRKCCFNVHNTNSSKPQEKGKNTDCGASINFRLETPISKDPVIKSVKAEYPLWLNVHFNHNHSCNRAEYFKFLSVTEDTKKFFEEKCTEGNSYPDI